MLLYIERNFLQTTLFHSVKCKYDNTMNNLAIIAQGRIKEVNLI